MVNIKKCLIMALTIVGSMIGVGFATGREVVSFFVRYGWWSILMIGMSAICFFAFIKTSLSLFVKTNHINKKCKMAKNGIKNGLKIGNLYSILDVIVFICQLAISSTMIAGFSSLVCGQASKVAQIVVSVVLCGVVFSLVSFRKNSVYWLNVILSILMFSLVIIVFIGATANGIKLSRQLFDVGVMFFVNPISYVGMNLIIVYSLLKEFSSSLVNKVEVNLVSFFISLFMFLSLTVVSVLLLLFGGDVFMQDMPIVSIAYNISLFFGLFYSLVVSASIFTTLISTVYSSSKFLSAKMRSWVAVFVVLMVSFVVSLFGFGGLIDYFYPIIGVVCIVFLILNSLKSAKMCY